MKKYILILLIIGQLSNAQYNLFARQNFNYKTVSTGTNTEIGGVASTISTPALLATKLGIDVSRITNFSIVGSDIKCRITGSYGIPSDAFLSNTSIIYYFDYEGLVTSMGYEVFKSSTITKSYFPNVTSTNTSVWTSGGGPLMDYVYIPRCTNLGGTVGDNACFVFYYRVKTIYADPSLATINGGAPDGDIAYAISQGATVRYVTNFTAPNPVTTLSAGTIYNTSVQLNFTPPSSTNAIDYYELYLNGILQAQRITASGQYITGLTPNTFYNIKLKAVDIFYNKSVVSNIVALSTTSVNIMAAETTSFASRISADSGTLIDQTYVNDVFCDKIIGQNLHLYLLAWHNYKSGIKKDGSEKVEKMYSFVDSNFDVVQTTAANKPTYTASGITFDLTDNLSKTLSPVVTNKTFSIVWRLKSTPENYYPSVNLGSWDSFTMHSASGGLIYGGITVANRFNLGSGSFLTNTDATYTFTYNSVTKQANIYRNTTLLGTKTMVDPINWTSFSFDAQNGTFYDIKVFSKDLSLTEITNIL